MPKFSIKSSDRLSTCHPDLQRLFEAVVVEYDCSIIEGHRNRRRQNLLYRQGKSRVKWPDGKHNRLPSEAVDAGPYLKKVGIPWNTPEEWHRFARFVFKKAEELGIRVRWGGDWDMDGESTDQSFNDLPHWELLRKGKET